MENKNILTILGILLIGIVIISLASAEFWACFDKGEIIHYCSSATYHKPDETCSDSMGCPYCMSIYNESEDCYVHGVWGYCQEAGQECTTFGNNSSIDTEPPILTLRSPVELGVYTSRSVLLEFSVNEESDVYYYDNINGRGVWTRVCNGCIGNYSGRRTFSEGFNDITLKAKDVIGNSVNETVTFFIDSKKPKILKTEPRTGYTNGLLHVEFQEDNPTSLKINYGNNIQGFTSQNINIAENCTYTGNSNKKYYCDISVNFDDYYNKTIEYNYTLTDIANNKVESRSVKLIADAKAPFINNPDSFASNISGRYVYFKIDITEEYVNEVFYTEGTKEVMLCSSLKKGLCESKKPFSLGQHTISLQVIDKAGNSISVPANFVI